MGLTNKEELKQLREKVYQKARNYRINHIMCDLDNYRTENLYGILNGESKFLWADPKLAALTGWSVYEIISMPLKRLLHKDDIVVVDRLYKQKESVDSIRLRLKTKDGFVKPINVKCDYNSDKNCVYCYSIT